MKQGAIIASGLLVVLLGVFLVVSTPDNDTSTTTSPESTTTQGETTSTAPTLPTSTAAPPASTTSTAQETTTTLPAGILIEVSFVGGKVVSLTANGTSYLGERVPVPFDDRVGIVVTADVTDEIHVHGYDLRSEVSPERPAVIEFDADIPGIFEVEFELNHASLFEFVVS